MSYVPQHGMSWQGIGYGKQWFALPTAGLGDALTDAQMTWVKEIAAYIENERRTGKSDATITSYLATPSAAKQFGYLGDTLPPEWINEAFKLATPTKNGMSTGAKVAIGAAVVVGAALLLRRKR